MKLMIIFHLFLYCATQGLGVEIQTAPTVISDGLIQTELESTVSLVCQSDISSGNQADEELVWLRNGAVISLKEENKKGRSTVCVTPNRDDNGATFTCHLKNNATVSSSVTLNVTYAPEMSKSMNISVEEEADLMLQCDIRANPLVSVSWIINGSKVDLVEGGFKETNDGFTSQLSASFVKKSLHTGTYQCSAISPKYTERTKTFYVTITDKTRKFPLMPIIAGVVVVVLTAILAVVSRWKKIRKCCQ